MPWWLLPNVLALDAPAVAAVWQRFLAHRAGLPVPWAATVALAATVWCIYLIDRQFDARRNECHSERHTATRRYPGGFAVLTILAAAIAATAASELPAEYLVRGLILGAFVAVYLLFAQLAAKRLRSRAGMKELLVALGFAAGVGLPLTIGDSLNVEWLAVLVAFGAICWLNCRLIDKWELSEPRDAGFEMALAAAILIFCFVLPLAVGVAVGTACIALMIVHGCFRNRPQVARALVDAALLTPLFCGAIP